MRAVMKGKIEGNMNSHTKKRARCAQ